MSPEKVILWAAGPQVAAQVPAGHKLEEQAHGASDGADTQQLDDVRVIEFGQEGGLALKVLDEVLRCLLLQHLDRHHRELLTLDKSGGFRLK